MNKLVVYESNWKGRVNVPIKKEKMEKLNK